jgi:hypothetical protein
MKYQQVEGSNPSGGFFASERSERAKIRGILHSKIPKYFQKLCKQFLNG